MMAYNVSSRNRTHDPTAIPLRHRDNPAGNGAPLWFCGILAEGFPIMLTLIYLYGSIMDPFKDAS